MRQPTHSIDGFVPRRPSRQMGGHIGSDAPAASGASGLMQPTPLPAAGPIQAPVLTRTEHGLTRRDIDDSLKDIDDQPRDSKKGHRKGIRAPKMRTKRIILWASIVLAVIALAVGGWLAYKALQAGGNVFKGNLLGVLQSAPLQEDANGRTNILVFGTSEDDPGHEAAYLTDSIMILSVDQDKKDARMFSLPRDLEVDYGTACMSGYRGKINVVYGCHYEDGENEEAGAKALQQTVSEVTGLDMHYYVHVNYTVVRQAVAAVDGITVTIESRDPRGQMDANFDWKCGLGDPKVSRAERLRRCPPSGHYIDYPNGPVKLDAEHALYLAQARGAGVNYGFEQSNFDREKNQQKIVKALREKAMSAGTLTNVGKVSGLLEAFGDNLRTSFEAKEMQTLVSLAKDMPSDKIQSISLSDGDTPVLLGNGNPAAGMYEFGDIHAFLAKKLSGNQVAIEEANVVVLNGTGVPGVAQQEADKLTAQAFTVTGVDNAPEGEYGKAKIYQIGTGMPATKAKLESIYGVKVLTETPPVAVTGDTNFVVIIGQAPSSQSQ